jgi:glucose-6-phosphate 1-dehydrogenase
MRTKVAVWGIKGNWCKISLIPALNQISKDYNITEIFGIARNEVNSEEILNEILGTNNNLSEIFSTVKVGSDISEYENLKNTIDLKSDEQLIVYLSVPANSVPSIIESLGKTGFSLPNVKILIEKPFGSDLESAEKLFGELHQWLKKKIFIRLIISW